MAVNLSKSVKVFLEFGEEHVGFIFPGWSDQELQKGIDTLLETRQVIEGRKVEDNSQQARLKFFDAHCQSVENAADEMDGEEKDLMTFNDWQARIPSSWKTSIVMQHFEERGTLSEADVKNS
tara:strand:- start:7745 stop:8110 length:366 start_codon:yes stop_codon:yes gene_type:complete